MSLLPYFLIVVEMLESPERPAAIAAMDTRLATGVLDFFISPAQAAHKWTPRRVAGAAIAKAITQAVPSGEAKTITALFKELVVSLKSIDAVKLRKFAHMSEFIRTGVGLLKRAGVNTVRSLLKPRADDRITRKALVAAIAFIEEQLSSGKLTSGNEMRLALATLYADAFIAKTESGRHGGSFQLLNIALLPSALCGC